MTTKEWDCDVAVVGGGAAGIVAAISAAREKASVLLLEKMPRVGKKILASGAGRCNLMNHNLDASFYNAEAREFIAPVLSQFGSAAALQFFKELGLAVTIEGNGRIFPATNQAVSVMEVLEMELERLGVTIRCHSEVTAIQKLESGFRLTVSSAKPLTARKVVLSGGGKSYPALGADGKAYALATSLGHSLIEPVPSTVPLVVNDPWCHLLQGQRIRAAAASWIHGKSGTKVEGELLFAQYGLSGTAILDVSEEISVAMNREHKTNVKVEVDLLPLTPEEELREELLKRLEKSFPSEKLLVGLLPPKFSPALESVLKTRSASEIARAVKHRRFNVSGTRGWNEAEFTAGGIDTQEVDAQTLESKCAAGLYLAGEILNVQGRRGGFNLGWAWASGFVVGEAAAGVVKT